MIRSTEGRSPHPSNRTRTRPRRGATLLTGAALLASIVTVVGATGCETQPRLGTVGGAGAGVAVGSMIGSGRGRTAAMVGGGLLGAYAGNQLVDRPNQEAQRRNAAADRDAEVQRQLDFERQVIIERDRAQRQIEEERAFEEWRRTRGA